MFIDSHCHLDFKDFNDDRADVLARAAEAGVELMVTICTRTREFDRVRELAEQHANLFCSVGTHPHNAGEEFDVSTQELVSLSSHPKVVAIGEAGLDYYYDNAPREAQIAGFRNHIAAARQTGLPLVIHARDADQDMIEILRDESGKGAFPFILHCFSSGLELAEIGVGLGGYVSFSGILTFKKSEKLREIAASLPHDRLLVETDAPYLAPVPKRGRRNEPAYVVYTALCLSEILGLELDDVARITTENFFRLFNKVPRLPGIREK